MNSALVDLMPDRNPMDRSPSAAGAGARELPSDAIAGAKERPPAEQTARRVRSHGCEGTPDFQQLLGAQAWARLPAAVQARFGRDAHTVTSVARYEGLATVRASLTGRVFAQLCRLVGTPVAPYVGERVHMSVLVYASGRGIVWERRYDFGSRQCTVRSTKELDGAGLVENLGMGLNMRLDVFERAGTLHFASKGYFFRIGSLRLHVPDWFLPGATHVVHEDLGAGQFRFTMHTEHRWFGEMYAQDGIFN